MLFGKLQTDCGFLLTTQPVRPDWWFSHLCTEVCLNLLLDYGVTFSAKVFFVHLLSLAEQPAPEF